MRSYFFLFPGQGSQFVGMGRSFYERFDRAKSVFERVDDALGEKLSSLIFDGAADELTLTKNAQPAIMAVSVAIYSVLEHEYGCIGVACAGHSLGEYSALVASGAISIEDAAILLRKRGLAMHSAVKYGAGAMAALLGVDDITKIEAICSEVGGICQIANDNGAGQFVISGDLSSIERAILVSKDYGVKKAIKLNVSGPFHSSMMQKAADEMGIHIINNKFAKPNMLVIANYDLSVHCGGDQTASLLKNQIANRVRWRETMQALYVESCSAKYGSGALFLEVGPGSALCNIAKRMGFSSSINISSIEDLAQIHTYGT